jgi:hypothetical protein
MSKTLTRRVARTASAKLDKQFKRYCRDVQVGRKVVTGIDREKGVISFGDAVMETLEAGNQRILADADRLARSNHTRPQPMTEGVVLIDPETKAGNDWLRENSWG